MFYEFVSASAQTERFSLETMHSLSDVIDPLHVCHMFKVTLNYSINVCHVMSLII